MQSIVTDKQRCAGPEAARPGGVALGSPSDIVASLGRATSPPRRNAPCRRASKGSHGGSMSCHQALSQPASRYHVAVACNPKPVSILGCHNEAGGAMPSPAIQSGWHI